MTYREFCALYAHNNQISKAEAARRVQSVFATLTQALRDDSTLVYILDFGGFSVREWAGREMQVGGKLKTVASKNYVRFRPAARLSRRVQR